jgi:tetratricopeptide (TPR) repeat protein
MADSDPDEAMRRLHGLLDADPDDAMALMLIGAIYIKAERYGLAVNIFKRVTEIRPTRCEGWSHLGLAYQGLKHDKARGALQKAWDIKQNSANAANMACVLYDEGKHEKSLEWAKKALQFKPDGQSAWTSYGMANLALGNWEEGWKGYSHSLGGTFRKEMQYQDEPKWDGTPDKTLIVYGEQGLGDEIMYASCIPDACKENSVVLECDPRLGSLFRRSFPSATVYARCAIGDLPRFYRNKREDFPATPYLVADPERRIQWKALLDSFGKRKIGLCWSGGSRHNFPQARAMGVESFRPLIEAVDATYVSLQYQDPTEEIKASGLPVKHWERINGSDYEETAALVAELDIVIGVHTSVQHLAGALGVPQIILVPDKTLWIYARDDFTWYPAKLVRQSGKPWKKVTSQIPRMLDAHL